LERIVREHGVVLHHIKLHGALYHASEVDVKLRNRYVKTVQRFWPNIKIYAAARGPVVQLARRAGLAVWEETFLDRAYGNDGKLVSRHAPGAILDDPRLVLDRIRDIVAGHGIVTVSGQRLRLRTQTLCVHSDTP